MLAAALVEELERGMGLPDELSADFVQDAIMDGLESYMLLARMREVPGDWDQIDHPS